MMPLNMTNTTKTTNTTNTTETGSPAPAKRIIQPLSERQMLAPQRAGYYDTVWPSEHTDLWRSHAVSHVGLPASFDPAKLCVTTAKLNLPVWGYTRNQNEVFVIGGSPATLNIFTQTIKYGGTDTTKASVIASLLAQASLRQHLEQRSECVPYVAKVNPLSMEVTLFNMTEGDTLNYTGGLLMHENGYVYAVSCAWLYKIDATSMQAVASVPLPKVGDKEQHYFTVYNGLQVLASGELVIKGFYFLNDAPVNGWLLLVDPETLAIDVQQSCPLSSARMAIQQAADGSATLYQVNTTEALRFTITDTQFVQDNAWTRTYRNPDDGSTQASSQLIFGHIGQVVFADNTVFGATTPIQLFTQPIKVEDVPPGDLAGVDAFSTAVPGANFMMVAGDPFETQTVVYYDPNNSLLSAHTVLADGTLASMWSINGTYKVSASPAIVPDRDLLYIDNYQNGRDALVVLRLSTGAELASVPLDANLPTIGTIFLGMNDDVYIINSEAGSQDGLISRIFVG